MGPIFQMCPTTCVMRSKFLRSSFIQIARLESPSSYHAALAGSEVHINHLISNFCAPLIKERNNLPLVFQYNTYLEIIENTIFPLNYGLIL